MSNAPPRHELFLLDEGQDKVEVKMDTRVPNTAVFTFNREDHTLGNLLTAHLHKYKDVTFAAYKVEHPLKPLFILRVGTDGGISPKDAVVRCCSDIITTLDKVSREFTKEMELFKIARGGESNGV
ncbi:DNA-directed RNA polymerase II subunit RPB11a [Microthyrium microscopicum]|uniref:DNA-directed RNA polymerase II subunit RPB11a n=1 Tax=Microthyrium microscopicum TaxID=703497 RepID=A0A6A6UE07_9PEZI|nr:DNA-directed RNA polymerase II subunit RPB11a [Microthyrium microscopicum]